MRKTIIITLGLIGAGAASLALAQTAPVRPITLQRIPVARPAAPDPQIAAMQAQLDALQAKLAQDEKTIASLKTQLGTVASQFTATKSDVLGLNMKTDATDATIVTLRTDFGSHKHYAYYEGPDAQGNNNIIKYLPTTMATTSCIKDPGKWGTQIWKCTAP